MEPKNEVKVTRPEPKPESLPADRGKLWDKLESEGYSRGTHQDSR